MNVEYFESVELTDLGLRRKNNEDSCLRLPDQGVFCVADGMGGVVGGDLASESITTNLAKVFQACTPAQTDSLPGRVRLVQQAANQASKWIKDFADEKVIGQMGSTVVTFILDPRNPGRAVALHAGDSRLYRLRAGKLEELTADHTAVIALAKKLGRDPSTLPAKYQNELMRAVGLSQTVELELTLVDIQSNDLFMLCSDGLSRMLTDDAITSVLKKAADQPLTAVAKELINGANEAGGKDNVTVVLIKVGDISKLPRPVVPEDDLESLMLAVTAEPPPVEMPPRAGGPARPQTSDSTQILQGTTPSSRETPHTPSGRPQPTPLTPETPLAPLPSGAGAPARGKSRGISQKGIVVIAVVALICALIAHFGFGNHPHTPTVASTSTTPPPVTNVVVENKSNTQIAATSIPVTNTTPPLPALIDFKVTSDPLLAELLVDDDTNSQKTPVTLHLTPGRHELNLKSPGLDDRKQSIFVSTDGPTTTNIQFVYGGVDLDSDPTGATIRSLPDLAKIGATPYVVNFLRTGTLNWQLSLDGYESANITVEISDHETVARRAIKLQRAQGTLQLRGDFPDIKATVDGESVGLLPENVHVTAGVPHTIVAERQGRQMTTNSLVKVHESTAVVFKFVDLAPVVVAFDKPQTWTNRLGMIFVKGTGNDFWIETTRITPQQYGKLVGSSLPDDATFKDSENPGAASWPIIPTFSEARGSAGKLKDVGGLPPGFESWHYALPTHQQWQKMAAQSEALGVKSKFVNYHEWCLDKSDSGDIAYRGGFVIGASERFTSVPIKPPPSSVGEVMGMTARFMLVP